MPQFITYNTAAESRTMEFLAGSLPASLVLDVASDFSGTETIPAFYVGGDDTRKTAMLDADGTAVVLSATNKVIPIYFPCKIRLEKPTSEAAMGVTIFTR